MAIAPPLAYMPFGNSWRSGECVWCDLGIMEYYSTAMEPTDPNWRINRITPGANIPLPWKDTPICERVEYALVSKEISLHVASGTAQSFLTIFLLRRYHPRRKSARMPVACTSAMRCPNAVTALVVTDRNLLRRDNVCTYMLQLPLEVVKRLSALSQKTLNILNTVNWLPLNKHNNNKIRIGLSPIAFSQG